MQLGHNGRACLNPVTEFHRPLMVIHTNGVHKVRVRFCQCGEPAGGHYFGTQLIRSRWFPSTMARPRTAFTFNVLNHFHHLTLQGKTTAWDFYNALIHETDNTGLATPEVCRPLSSFFYLANVFLRDDTMNYYKSYDGGAISRC